MSATVVLPPAAVTITHLVLRGRPVDLPTAREITRASLIELQRTYSPADWPDLLSCELHDQIKEALELTIDDAAGFLALLREDILVTPFAAPLKGPLITPVLDNNGNLWDQAQYDDYCLCLHTCCPTAPLLSPFTEEPLTGTRPHAFAAAFLALLGELPAPPVASTAIVAAELADMATRLMFYRSYGIMAQMRDDNIIMRRKAVQAAADAVAAREEAIRYAAAQGAAVRAQVDALRRDVEASLAERDATQAATLSILRQQQQETAARQAENERQLDAERVTLADARAQLHKIASENHHLRCRIADAERAARDKGGCIML